MARLSLLSQCHWVLSTHELKYLNYNGTPCHYHVFLLGCTENGLIVFDIASSYGVNNDARDWLKKVFNKTELKCLLLNGRFQELLPQFRFIDGNTYRLFCWEDIKSDSSVLTPNLVVKHQDRRCFNYRLWNDSFFLNMHDTWQMFSGQKTYAESVAPYISYTNGFLSPKDRLSDDCLRELGEALELF